MLTRSNPEFSQHTYTHTQSYRTKCDFVLYVFGAWKNEHPDKRVFLRAFFLIQIFPHTQQAVLEHQHTNTCEHSRRTHTHTAKVTHSHTCARFLGGYRSWRCLPSGVASMDVVGKLSHTCLPVEIGMCEL